MDMEKMLIGSMMAIVMMLVLVQVVQGITPQPPQVDYCCPICAQLGTPQCFTTYDELYQHFTTQHPAQPIDIIWE